MVFIGFFLLNDIQLYLYSPTWCLKGTYTGTYIIPHEVLQAHFTFYLTRDSLTCILLHEIVQAHFFLFTLLETVLPFYCFSIIIPIPLLEIRCEGMHTCLSSLVKWSSVFNKSREHNVLYLRIPKQQGHCLVGFKPFNWVYRFSLKKPVQLSLSNKNITRIKRHLKNIYMCLFVLIYAYVH